MTQDSIRVWTIFPHFEIEISTSIKYGQEQLTYFLVYV